MKKLKMNSYKFNIKNSDYKCIIEAESKEKAKERFNILFNNK